MSEQKAKMFLGGKEIIGSGSYSFSTGEFLDEDKLENEIMEDLKHIFEKYINKGQGYISIGRVVGIMYSAFLKVVMIEHDKRFSDNYTEWAEGVTYKIGDVVKMNEIPNMEDGYYRYTENGFVFIGKERP